MEKTRSMAMTPYNFIPFPKDIVYRYKAFSDLPAHTQKDDKEESEELKTGWIEYHVETLSPLFIGDGEGEFFNIDGAYKIPGSTMKGKIRSNAEILSHAQPQFIDDQKFWYRALADKSIKLREEYTKNLKNIADSTQKKSIETSVRAGYIRQEGSKYKIISAKQDEKGCYFQRIRESRLRDMEINNENCEDIFMYKKIDWDSINKLKNERRQELDKGNKNKDKEILNKIDALLKDDKKNNNRDNGNLKAFKPYSKKVYYKLDEKGKVVDISTHSQGNWKEGYLTNSSNLGNKQVHYLFFEADETIKILVPRDVVTQFKVNVEYRNSHEKNLFDVKETIRNMGNIDENLKPIFYQLEGNEIKVIGFTPYLKIPYRYSICENCPQIDEIKIDYVQGLFGMTAPKAYKSRLIFDSLDLESPDIEPSGDVRLPLMNPKPTSFQLYIKQTTDKLNELKNYNDADFELNGYKFYYLKETTHEARVDNATIKNNSTDYLSTLKPIEKARFKGKIHFKNLHDDELGLLLMALEPFKNSKDSLGQGKPFGFGKVKIAVDKIWFLQENSNEKSADIIEEIQNIAFNKQITSIIEVNEKDHYKENFKEKIESLAKSKLFDSSNEAFKAFEYSKKVEVSHEAYRYMELKAFSERKVLATIEDAFGKKNKKAEDEVINKKEDKNNKSKKNHVKNSEFTLNNINTISSNILIISKNTADENKMKNEISTLKRVNYSKIENVKNLNKFNFVILNNCINISKKELEIFRKALLTNEDIQCIVYKKSDSAIKTIFEIKDFNNIKELLNYLYQIEK